MSAQVPAASREALERLHTAMNQHDLEAFLACFDPHYRSEQPAHPIRGFGGREQVEKNWSAMFEGMGRPFGDVTASSACGPMFIRCTPPSNETCPSKSRHLQLTLETTAHATVAQR